MDKAERPVAADCKLPLAPVHELSIVPVAMPMPQDSAGTIRRLAKTHPLYPCGKREHQALIAVSSPGESARSRVLFIHERNSGKRFKIDSGADVSTISPNFADRQRLNNVFCSKLSTERALKPTTSACSNSILTLVVLFPMFLSLLMFPTPSVVLISSNDSIFPSVFSGGASLMIQLAYQ